MKIFKFDILRSQNLIQAFSLSLWMHNNRTMNEHTVMKFEVFYYSERFISIANDF